MYKVCMKLYKIILNIEMWKNEINEMRSVVVNASKRANKNFEEETCFLIVRKKAVKESS